jgi:hypothetical protein
MLHFAFRSPLKGGIPDEVGLGKTIEVSSSYRTGQSVTVAL